MSLSVVPRTGPDYSPGQRFHLEKSKTRVRVRTSLGGLPGCWLPGTCLGGARGSKTESPGLGLERPECQSWLALSPGGLRPEPLLDKENLRKELL